MSFFKQRILHHSSVPWKITPLYFFSSNNIYFAITPLYFFSSDNICFAQKEPIKVKIFETFEGSGQNLSNYPCIFWNDKSTPIQILHQPSLSWHITPLQILSSLFFYFGLKDPINVSIFRISRARVKINQIPHANFETTSQFLFKLCIIFIVMTHNSFVNFKLLLFILWIKGPHQSPNFETFKCSSENLPYSSCHFPKHKSVFLQILHHSSVSSKITPVYFFRSNIKYFAQ